MVFDWKSAKRSLPHNPWKLDMDDYPFGDAFAEARKKFGSNARFTWRGEVYTTDILGEKQS